MPSILVWEPVSTDGKYLSTPTPGQYISSLIKAFGGEDEWLLDAKDLDKVDGMVAVDRRFFELRRILRRHGEIRIWVVKQ